MRVNSETEMLEFGRQIAKQLTLPAVIELVGDVGVGKTTFTRGLAEGLGISEPITSPSFTISKRYGLPLSNLNGELVHYDFYRLNDPGIMRDELADTLTLPDTLTVIEWGNEVSNLLPESRIRLDISLNPDGSREIEVIDPLGKLSDLWKTCAKLSDICGKDVDKTPDSVQKPGENS